jgi:guanylate kinase
MTIGTLFIISAPSGAGKTSLVKQLVANMDNLLVSVSNTTRKQRPGEMHGQDYFFVAMDEFKAMLSSQAFLEHAQVFDNFYGTARETVEANLHAGIDVILEIDWQGAQQIKSALKDSISIFIFPPSIDVLQQRLQDRGQDSEETISKRMKAAVTEMSHYAEFDYLLINDNFNQALLELKSIVTARRLKTEKQQSKLNEFIQTLLLQTNKNSS